VIAPANTGKANNNNIAVIKTAHVNKVILCILKFTVFILSTVVIKFIAPKIEEAPAKCKLKISK
jgi:hypothetical protein